MWDRCDFPLAMQLHCTMWSTKFIPQIFPLVAMLQYTQCHTCCWSQLHVLFTKYALHRIICPQLALPENGNVSVSSYYPGGTAVHTCDSGYNVTNRHRLCLDEGRWSGKAATCERKPIIMILPSKYNHSFSWSPWRKMFFCWFQLWEWGLGGSRTINHWLHECCCTQWRHLCAHHGI